MYGSSRIGLHGEKIALLGTENDDYSMESITHHIGDKNYELTNHLGNVLSVISDKVISHDDDADDIVDWFLTDIRLATDYSPFGVPLEGRKFEKTIITCTEITDTITTTILNEDFTSGGSWTKLSLIGTGLSYGSGEMINTKTSSTVPLLPVGSYKDFTIVSGGNYTVSLDVISNTCGYPIILNIKDNVGNVIATANCTSTGTHSLDFSLPGSGTYSVEIRRSTNIACSYRVDNVSIVYHEITTDTICNENQAWYRYAFNGMEKDDELKGNGNSYTTEFRQYDPRLGRWLSLDPMMNKFPWQSPYVGMDNNPIYFIDPLGSETEDNFHIFEDGKVEVQKTDDPTNSYYYHHCDGTEELLLTVDKAKNGMVNMPKSTEFYDQVLYKQGLNYLPADAAAGFIGATYRYYFETCYQTKINQFMTECWFHSGTLKSKVCIDVQYIGVPGLSLAVQPESQNNNVDVGRTNDLARLYRMFGFDTDGEWSCISLAGDFKSPLLEYSAALVKHHNHFHIQGWKYPTGDYEPSTHKVINSGIIIGKSQYKSLATWQSIANDMKRANEYKKNKK